MKEFLKTTIIGGALFLLPAALVLVILGHALRIATKAAQPVSDLLHLEQMGKVVGAVVVTAMAVILLLLVSFAAGLAARTKVGSRIRSWVEHSFLGGLPQYQMVKSMAEGVVQAEGASGDFKPVLVSSEGGWQIGYVLEPLKNGW